MNTSALIAELDKQIARLREARNLLEEQSTPARRGRPASKTAGGRAKRNLSPEARAKMAAAQKRRWAAYRKAK